MDFSKVKIMIVDDSKFTRDILCAVIREIGITDICEVKDGKSAVDLYKINKPDLVVMDIMLSDMRGTKAMEDIIALDPDAKVVICSALGRETDIKDAMSRGAKGYIVKPIDGRIFVQLINDVLNGGSVSNVND